MIFRISTILLLIFPAVSVAGELRTWADSTGRLRVDAELIDFQPGKVWLRRDDGETFGVALTDLSPADQDYVREFVRRREAAVPVDRSEAAGRIKYGMPRRLCNLADEKINESSGLACSRRYPGMFWTHNDSGDDARLYLLDTKGRSLGSCLLDNVLAYDWEDIASFKSDGKPYLLVGDVGNNGRSSAVQMLHLIEEPDFDPGRGLDELLHEKVPVVRTIYYSYEDDYRDCEAVAVDPTDKTILLVSKERAFEGFVYALPWPPEIPNKAFVARLIGKLKIPPVTAMDVSPDGHRAVVATYLNAYEFVRGETEDWAKAFSRPPQQIILPLRAQGESICYGPDGKTLYVTSEKRPTPLWEIPVDQKARGEGQAARIGE